MKRSLSLFLLACAMAFTLTLPAKSQVRSCCTGADRQHCSAVGCRAICDIGACLCACPVS